MAELGIDGTMGYSYVEPSTQWGLAYLDAIRDVFGRP
jgi:hypothetical protein